LNKKREILIALRTLIEAKIDVFKKKEGEGPGIKKENQYRVE